MEKSRLRKLRLTATVLMIAAICFSIYWSTRLLFWLVPHVTTDSIYMLYYVEADASVTLQMRMIYGLLWGAVIVSGWIAAAYGVKLLWHVRQGRYFERMTAKAIKQFGGALAVTMVADTILGAFGHSVLTWGNASFDAAITGSVGYVAPSYFYDSGDITVFLCALGFFLIGWVLQEGERIAAENQGFI